VSLHGCVCVRGCAHVCACSFYRSNEGEGTIASSSFSNEGDEAKDFRHCSMVKHHLRCDVMWGDLIVPTIFFLSTRIVIFSKFRIRYNDEF
jgi:hypothetical protein